TAGGRTARGAAFTVHGDLAPKITGVGPPLIVPGDPITIRGRTFSSVRAENNVALDGNRMRVLSASPTRLTAVLPSVPYSCFPTEQSKCYSPYVAGSGPVAVSTPSGATTSARDVYVALLG